MIILKKTIIFQVSRGRGSNISKGVKLFPGVVQLLIPYRNPYKSWFSRGVGVQTLYPPLDPLMYLLKYFFEISQEVIFQILITTNVIIFNYLIITRVLLYTYMEFIVNIKVSE